MWVLFCKDMKKLLTSIILIVQCVLCYSQEAKDTVLTSTIYFNVNTTTVVDNDPGYEKYVMDILPYLWAHLGEFQKIVFRGGASPEGPQKGNEELARNRAKKIYDLAGVGWNRNEFVYANEDYEHLLGLVEESDKYYRDTVSSIIKSNYRVKTRLKELDEGKVWKDMISDFFPHLRATRVEVYFKVKPCQCKPRVDTVYIRERDTLYFRDTIYLREKPRVIPILAVKTNAIADVLITPNIQAELYTWLWGLSLEFDYTFPWWHKDYDQYFYYQILNGTAGIRKYINNSYTGHWIGIYANTAIYDICFWNKDKGWQGEVYGAGLGYGYVFQSKKHPRIKFEPYVRFGWFNTKFDTYHASQPWNEKYYYNWYLRASDFVPRRFSMNYFGPTEIGFNLTFDLVCVRKY